MTACPNCDEPMEFNELTGLWYHARDLAPQFDCYSDGELLEFAESQRTGDPHPFFLAMAEVVRRGLAESPRRRERAREER